MPINRIHKNNVGRIFTGQQVKYSFYCLNNFNFCYNVNGKLPSTYLLYTIGLSRSIYRSQYGDAAGLLEPEKKEDSIYKSAGYFCFYFGDTFEQGPFQTSCSCCAELNSFDRIKFDFSTAVARRLKPSAV